MIRPLTEVFVEMEDPREQKGKRYELWELMTVMLLASMSGENSRRGIAAWIQAQKWELKEYFGWRGGRAPSYGAIRKLLKKLNVEQLEAELSGWEQGNFKERNREEWTGVAIDGKTVRGSQNEETGEEAIHLLSAFSHRLEIVLGQRQVDSKTNEIPEARHLLDSLELDGILVTMDALHTQRHTAEAIVEKGGPT